jgi:hypothetical protein
MKKSLVMLVVLVSSLALAGSVFAAGDWGCYSTPGVKKAPCVDQVLCKGKAKGMEKLCGPGAPSIKWSGSWMTVLKCPAVDKPAKVAKAKKFKK